MPQLNNGAFYGSGYYRTLIGNSILEVIKEPRIEGVQINHGNKHI